MHKYCLKGKCSQKRVERVCPGCGTARLHPVSKIEAAEEDDDNTIVPSQNQPPPRPSMRNRLGTCRVVDSGTLGSSSSQAPVPEGNNVKLCLDEINMFRGSLVSAVAMQ